MGNLENLKLDVTWDGKVDKKDFEKIWIELKEFKEEAVREVAKKLAPVYVEEFDKLKWKELYNVVFLLQFAISKFWNQFKEGFLEWKPVNINWQVFEVKGIEFDDLLRFLDALAELEATKDFLEYKQIVLTLNELKELEKVIKTKDEKDDIEFLKAQFAENVSSYEILSKVEWFNRNLESYLKKNCKSSNTKECSAEYVLNKLDTQFEKVLKTIMPKNISLDTLRNMATWFNIGMMIIYQDLPEDQKEAFFKWINWLTELFEGKWFIDKIDGIVWTIQGAKIIKLFSNIYDFFNKIKTKADDLNLHSEDDWESFIYLNNPTYFAKKFKKYINLSLEWKKWKADKIIDDIFKEENRLRKSSWETDLQFDLRKAKSNGDRDPSVLEDLAKFSAELNDENIGAILSLSKAVEKATEVSTKIKEWLWKFWKKVKEWTEKLADLLCIGKEEWCKMSIMMMLYKVYSFIIDILNSFGIHIEKTRNLDDEILEKFNETAEKAYFRHFIMIKFNVNKKEWRADSYFILSELFKKSIFSDYFKDKKQDKFANVEMEGNLSEETMKWIVDQGVDVFDEDDLWKFLKELFNKKEWRLVKKLKDKNKDFVKSYKIFKIRKSGQRWKTLIIDLSETDRLLRETFDYGKVSFNWYVNEYNSSSESLDWVSQNIREYLVRKNEDFIAEVKRLYPNIKNFSYIKYVKAIAINESWWKKYNIINQKSWALGKYQFMPNTLKDYKDIICGNSDCDDQVIKQKFLNNPLIQEKVMFEYTLSHLKQIKSKYEDLDEEKLVFYLAKAHFTGIGNLEENYSDGNTTANTYALKAVENYKVA